MGSRKERVLSSIAWVMFIFYLLILVRIILFKDTQLYNLFAMIGHGQRKINIIPFVSTFEMISSMGSMHILQNMVGNIAIFFPMGIFTPLLTNKGFKQTFLLILGISIGIEVTQFALAVGISDIDDVILNMLGALAGWSVFKYIQKTIKRRFIFRLSIIGMLLVFGLMGCFAIVTTETRLLQISPKQVTVNNPELIEGLDYGSIYVSGKYMGFKASELTIEKVMVNQNMTAGEMIEMELDQNTRIIVEQVESKVFFDIIISEHYTYSSLTYDQFMSSASMDFQNSYVNVWSADGKRANTILIVKP